MEIRIKTYDEISSERVTIAVAPGQRIEIELAERAGDAGTIEILRDRLTELEQRVELYDEDRHTESDRANRAEADLRRAREEMGRRFTTAQVEDAKADARADARAAMQREVVKPLEEKLAEAEQSLQVLADLLGKVNGLMLGSEIRQALEGANGVAPVRAEILATAVRKVREVLGVSWDGKAPRAA